MQLHLFMQGASLFPFAVGRVYVPLRDHSSLGKSHYTTCLVSLMYYVCIYIYKCKLMIHHDCLPCHTLGNFSMFLTIRHNVGISCTKTSSTIACVPQLQQA